MKCPTCRNQFNYKKEGDINGDTTCLICGTTAPTSQWTKPRKTKNEKRLEAQLANVKQLLEKAYLAGFNATGEGYNGEYPYGDRNLNPEEDTEWLERRDEKLRELLEETNG